MCAGGANIGSLGANDDVSAVAALPDLDLALLKDGGGLYVGEQRAITLLVMLLNGGNQAELLGKLGKALLLCRLGKAIVHIGPLVVLTLGGVLQVLCRVADAAKLLEPHLGVLLLVLGRLEEERGDLLVALLLGNRCKVGVLISCLGLACKGSLKVLLGLRSGILVGRDLHDLLQLVPGDVANGANGLLSYGNLKNGLADLALEFSHGSSPSFIYH